VLSKINVAVGTREKSTQAPVAYEMPSEVVREAIVNAIAHRDYTSKASVQVMLFSDRLEVWNPGALPPTLTLEQLRQPHGSYPMNPLLAEPLYLSGYIERMGTGTGDMIRRCRDAGLEEPVFALNDGFVVTIRRKPESAFEAVGGVTGEVTLPVTPPVALPVTVQGTRTFTIPSLVLSSFSPCPGALSAAPLGGVQRILDHLGLPTAQPLLQPRLWWEELPVDDHAPGLDENGTDPEESGVTDGTRSRRAGWWRDPRCSARSPR